MANTRVWNDPWSTNDIISPGYNKNTRVSEFIMNGRSKLPPFHNEMPTNAILWLLNFNTSYIPLMGTGRDKNVWDMVDMKEIKVRETIGVLDSFVFHVFDTS